MNFMTTLVYKVRTKLYTEPVEIVRDHTQFKNQCTFLDPVMWFIFNLHRKKHHYIQRKETQF